MSLLLLPLCAAALALSLAAAQPSHPDWTINATQIVWSPESGPYLGSPSILNCNGSLIASHDTFGPSSSTSGVFLFRSLDGGISWAPIGQAPQQYWATLFTREGDPALYLMGTSGDAGVTQAAVSRSLDCGATWSTSTVTASTVALSTGPTPVLALNGRLWRAYERNNGAWAAGYQSFVLSANLSAPDLLLAGAWVASPALAFPSSAVPANWSDPRVQSSFGWLEGGVVPPPPGEAGVWVVLRVNSIPVANFGALVKVDGPTSVPVFMGFVTLPGGMSKFTVRWDPVAAVYVTLSNLITDARVSLPPVCPLTAADLTAGALAASTGSALPCCAMQQLTGCPPVAPACLWCRAIGRNNLTLATSPDLRDWTVRSVVLHDDSGLDGWSSQLYTGFQYADFQLDGEDLVAAERASYRTGNSYHNANRMLFSRVVGWRELLKRTG